MKKYIEWAEIRKGISQSCKFKKKFKGEKNVGWEKGGRNLLANKADRRYTNTHPVWALAKLDRFQSYLRVCSFLSCLITARIQPVPRQIEKCTEWELSCCGCCGFLLLTSLCALLMSHHFISQWLSKIKDKSFFFLIHWREGGLKLFSGC